ncbi:MAG: helicase-associated domain-containing protein [Anaerolineaceae bacterium]|nr:MAG: helicase-associated domain-containing protein [Anaerolineaceae bacterium]
MRSLLHTLQDYDLGHLRIVAELWGIDLPQGPARQAAEAIARTMLDPATVTEITESLPPAIREALDHLLHMGGRAPLSDFVRRYGPFREMGPGRRDREKPWRDSASPIESLWYRGLIARAFIDTPSGPREFVFIPSDLEALLPVPAPAQHSGSPGGSIDPPPISLPATSVAVDDATTLLAALRRYPGDDGDTARARLEAVSPFLHQPESLNLLLTLLREEGILIQPSLQPDPQSVRSYLDTPRTEALRRLILAWKRSSAWNELAHVPHLTYTSEEWPNDPLPSRRTVLEYITQIPLRSWWDLSSFIATIRDQQPGFQRPAGDFDSWYLRDIRTGTFLRGFEYWDAIEGALLYYLITGPMHWLGIADLGRTTLEGEITTFRLTPAAAVLSDPETHLTIKESTASATIHSDGRIFVPRRALRALRYQIARFTSWEPIDDDNYSYRLTPVGLKKAFDQGLELSHVFTILESAGGETLPTSLKKALERWESHGSEGHFRSEMILQLRSPEVLLELQGDRTTARYLGEVLGPTTVTVHEGDLSRLRSAATRLGILLDPPPTLLESEP